MRANEFLTETVDNKQVFFRVNKGPVMSKILRYFGDDINYHFAGYTSIPKHRWKELQSFVLQAGDKIENVTKEYKELLSYFETESILNESISLDEANPIFKNFIKFTAKELELDNLPKINLIKDQNYSVKHHSFGGYRPSDKSINIMISNRHIQDVLRTLAHELVHYRQDINNQLNPDSGNDGSPEENEANSVAAVCMRKWGKMHPELFGKESLE